MTLEMFPIPADFDHLIRKVEKDGQVYLSLVDIMAYFTDSKASGQYWRDTKKRLKTDGFDGQEKIFSIKMKDSIGRMQATDCADARTCLRIIQSIPSPKAEPIRQWMAQLAQERLEEHADPELGIQRSFKRAGNDYRNMGKEDVWIETRQRGILKRKTAMDAAAAHAAEPFSYAELTNIEYIQLFQRKAQQLRAQLGGKNPRDSMTRLALIAVEWTEAAFEELLKQRGEQLTRDELYTAMQQCASGVGATVQQMQTALGIDLVTGKPLLSKGQSS